MTLVWAAAATFVQWPQSALPGFTFLKKRACDTCFRWHWRCMVQSCLQQLKLVVVGILLLKSRPHTACAPRSSEAKHSPEPCCAPQPPSRQLLTVPGAEGCSRSSGPAGQEASNPFKLMISCKAGHPELGYQKARIVRQLLIATHCMETGQVWGRVQLPRLMRVPCFCFTTCSKLEGGSKGHVRMSSILQLMQSKKGACAQAVPDPAASYDHRCAALFKGCPPAA